ncbi:dihydrofolate reductase family protein [Arsenicicoccus sp. oral taxon 190]|uniref:dihydrofolate reductase family protein n=1 Tax=Arsenicicoccus sp. oral taxon 190 TaxID=1658671 RepID=UPI000679EB55|nr:dihydrofolate reductase family protein [Arsenicicoccus sp. oral taxon 190]AKT50970.1 deaminase/reductase [Arsenicicoccus sp. oral taxon 190]
MGRLVYTSIGSLDGYVADTTGDFGWCAPDEEVHAYLNARERGAVTQLYGRRLYEVLRVWETYGTEPDAHPVEREYGELWRSQHKVVFSRTLDDVTTSRTTLARTFDPAQVRRLVDDTHGDVGIGGPELAAVALLAGIVDQVEYYASPVIVGGGTHWLPAGLRLGLRLVDAHRFSSGVVHLVYQVT